MHTIQCIINAVLNWHIPKLFIQYLPKKKMFVILNKIVAYGMCCIFSTLKIYLLYIYFNTNTSILPTARGSSV